MRFVIFILLIAIWFGAPGLIFAKATATGSYYVTAVVLNERLAPSKDGKVTNKIYRQQRVKVFELRNGWARISRYYDGQIEGLPGKVARWVAAAYLSKQRPPDRLQPKFVNDPKIQGIPKVGEYGLTKKDILVLYRGAKYFLKTGRCDHIEYGDKSLKKPNTYYVNCGGSRNLFFTPFDIQQEKPQIKKSSIIGRTLFNGKGVCFGCHGRDGNSDQIPDSTIDRVKKLNPKPTNVRTSTSLREKADEEIFRLIKFGKPGTAMVASMKQVNDEEIWQLVSYLREINNP